MKKLGLFLCAVVLTIGVSQAQSFNFGIKGGVTLNSLSYDQEAGLQQPAGCAQADQAHPPAETGNRK